MRKIAAVANSNAKKLASQGKLGDITPGYIEKMEMHKAAYLVDHAMNAMNESGVNIHQDVMTEIVKTANACIPAMSTLLPMDKFAALCDKVLEGAAIEVGNGMQKKAGSSQSESFNTDAYLGYRSPSTGDFSMVPGLSEETTSFWEDGDEIPEDDVNAPLFSDSTANMLSQKTSDDTLNALLENILSGTESSEEVFGKQAFGALESSSFDRVAQLKYIDTMNTINKVASMLEKFVKTAGEAGNTAEVAKQVKDEDSPSAAKPAETMVQAAAKKPDINSTTTKKPDLNSQAVASDVSKNVTEFDAKNAPTLAQGNINPTDGSVKLSALGYDDLIAQCSAIFSKK